MVWNGVRAMGLVGGGGERERGCVMEGLVAGA